MKPPTQACSRRNPSIGFSGRTRQFRSTRQALFLFVSALAIQAMSVRAQAILYVDGSAGGANDGSSWGDAYVFLQDALAASQSGDEIWVAAGTYFPDQGAGVNEEATNASFEIPSGVAVYGGFTGAETAREERDPDPATNGTILSGAIDDIPDDGIDAKSEQIVFLQDVVDVVLDGFTIREGSRPGLPNPAAIFIQRRFTNDPISVGLANLRVVENYGGIVIMGPPFGSAAVGEITMDRLFVANNELSAIDSDDATVTINDSEIRDNNAPGIVNKGVGDLTVVNTVIAGNTGSSGGGIANNSVLALRQSTVEGNEATEGGGLFNNGSAVVALTVFRDNQANNGGGIYNPPDRAMTIVGTAFTANVASGRGGGVYNRADSGFELHNSFFFGNMATDGGGLYNEGVHDGMNLFFSGNTASDEGGAVFNDGQTTLRNSTVVGNSATSEGGGMFNNNASGNQIILYNTILWGNTAPTGPELFNEFTRTSQAGYSIIEGGLPAQTADLGGNIFEDPLFVDPDGPDDLMGTPDDNPAVQVGSPAIDAGNNEWVPPDVLDIDGNGDTSEQWPVALGTPPAGASILSGLSSASLSRLEAAGMVALDSVLKMRESNNHFIPQVQASAKKDRKRLIDGDGDGMSDVDIGADEADSGPPGLQADLSINKSLVNDDLFQVHRPGDQIVYRLTVTNEDDSITAEDVTVVDTLPEEVQYQNAETSQGSVTESNGTVTFDLGDVPAGATVEMSIVVVVGDSQSPNDRFVANTATVSSATGDPDDGNNESSQDVFVGPELMADLSIDKRVDDPDRIYHPGEVIIYRLSVTNEEDSDTAEDVTVVDALPEEVQFLEATTSQGSFSASDGMVTFDLGDVPAGATVEMTITAEAKMPASIVNVRNVATVSSTTEDPEDVNNENDEFVLISPLADLQLVKQVDKEQARVGDILTYTLAALNFGPDDAPRVEIIDDLPPSATGEGLAVEVLNVDISKGECQIIEGHLTCDVGTMARDETVTLVIQVRALEEGPLLNDANVTGDVDEIPTDGGLSNNGNTTQTEIKAELGDLSIDLGDAPDGPDEPSYPTTLDNNGAYHILSEPPNIFLGKRVDADFDVTPPDLANRLAARDDLDGALDDEDGVELTTSLTPGQDAQVTIEASTATRLNAWVDFNIDGDWEDSGEQIFDDQELNLGLNYLSFPVPADAVTGNTYARFRVSSQGDLGFTGEAPDGEVEDYIWPLGPFPAALRPESLDDGTTVLSSPFGGIFESAPEVTGPWSEIPDASFPYRLNFDGSDQGYFRLRPDEGQ